MRIENESPTGFRLAWDLPETESCYGDGNIVILLTYRVLCIIISYLLVYVFVLFKTLFLVVKFYSNHFIVQNANM